VALKSQHDELAQVLCECAEAGPVPHPITTEGCSFPKVVPQSYPRFSPQGVTPGYSDNPWANAHDTLGIYATLAAAAPNRRKAKRWRDQAKMIRGGRAALVDNIRRWRNASALAAAAAQGQAEKAAAAREARYLPRTRAWVGRWALLAPPAVQASAATIAAEWPELVPGAAVISYPSWSRDRGYRPHAHAGVLLGYGGEGVGGVRVQLERMHAPTRLDPRDVVPAGWYDGLDAQDSSGVDAESA
jgi:hypothetical protein